jgi:hypothetical protein
MSKEIATLIELLYEGGVPFELGTDVMGNVNNQVFYPSKDEKICDAICHEFSYGGKEGLLEIMGLVEVDDDDVEGYLTASEVAYRIKKHYYLSEVEKFTKKIFLLELERLETIDKIF